MIEYRIIAKTNKVITNFKKAAAKDMGQLNKLMAVITTDIEREAKQSIARPKTGELYRSRRNPGQFYRASNPGEPPAADTQVLLKNIRGKVLRTGGKTKATGRVISGANYSAYLEFGFGMKARPFLRPALEKYYPKFRDGIRRIVNKRV